MNYGIFNKFVRKYVRSRIGLAFVILALCRPVFGLEQDLRTATVIHFGDSSVERYAACELQRYLVILTQKNISLRDWTIAKQNVEPNNAAGFVIGTPAGLAAFGDKFKALLGSVPQESDGYVIASSTDGKTMYITAWRSRGVLYGVYDYLQNRGGMGFFEDGEYIPPAKKIPAKELLPPFKENPKSVVEVPRFDYRSQWIWTRYYGAKKGHPLTWEYNDWVKHLRWLAQQRFSSVMLYPVGYTRLWGDVHLKAFPETAAFDKEVWNDVNDFWGAHYSAMAGWGRSPQETTALMQKVLKFGREELGLKFEYNFYLGNFEETLMRAYPEGIWISWKNVPHHAYFGAAGRSPILAFTDPRSKDYNQRLWRKFIETFGTDHMYWIAYREESAPNPANPNDPDKGKSLADAVNTCYQWLKDVDPKADCFSWDWHARLTWVGPDLIKKYSQLENPAAKNKNLASSHGYIQPEAMQQQRHKENSVQYPPAEVEKVSRAFIKSIAHDITIVNVLPRGLHNLAPWELTNHYEPHPWVIGTFLGGAGYDLGLGGMLSYAQGQLNSWKQMLEKDASLGRRLRGVVHWNEVLQVDPFFDHVVGEFAWTGNICSITNSQDPNVQWYFDHRFGEDGSLMSKCSSEIYTMFPWLVTSMRLPFRITANGVSDSEAKTMDNLISVMRQAVSLRDRQKNNPLYTTQIIDWSQTLLHTASRLHLQAARAAALKGDTPQTKAQFEREAAASRDALSTLAEILATDRRHSLSDSIYRMTNEPGANRLLRSMMLEHASGRMFGGYCLNDTPEYIRLVAMPLLNAYLANQQKTMNDPNANPIDKANDFNDQANKFTAEFMNLPGGPFEQFGSRRNPADILNDWLIRQRQGR